MQIKCIDPEDQMSVDSYFFASFTDVDAAYGAIRRVLDERPSSELPKVSSSLSFREQEAAALQAEADKDQAKQSGSGPLGIKKLGSVLKPLLPKGGGDSDQEKVSDDSRSGFSIPFISKNKHSNDSAETLRTDYSPKPSTSSLPATKDTSRPTSVQPSEESDGYPPRQSGPAPPGMSDEGKASWGQWMKKPATKIFGSSPSQASLLGRSPPPSSTDFGGRARQANQSPRTRAGRTKQPTVTEVVESAIAGDDEVADDESSRRGSATSRTARFSFTSDASSGTVGRSEYDIMERSESGKREDEETARKFRTVFSLSEKEELIDRKSILSELLTAHVLKSWQTSPDTSTASYLYPADSSFQPTTSAFVPPNCSIRPRQVISLCHVPHPDDYPDDDPNPRLVRLESPKSFQVRSLWLDRSDQGPRRDLPRVLLLETPESLCRPA